MVFAAVAVRKGFTAMVRATEFLADAGKAKIDIDVVTGDEIDTLLKRVYATPPETVEAVRKAIVE